MNVRFLLIQYQSYLNLALQILSSIILFSNVHKIWQQHVPINYQTHAVPDMATNMHIDSEVNLRRCKYKERGYLMTVYWLKQVLWEENCMAMKHMNQRVTRRNQTKFRMWSWRKAKCKELKEHTHKLKLNQVTAAHKKA